MRKLLRAIPLFRNHELRISSLEERLDLLTTSMSFYLEAKQLFVDLEEARQSEGYNRSYLIDEPKVTVCVCTYNRKKLLLERTIPSILGQTYRNIELMIVGDGCVDGTFDEIKKLNDSRIVAHNLPERGKYPLVDSRRWLVAGCAPYNYALEHASGDFVTHLDDDDEYAQNRLELLVSKIKKDRCELLYHPFHYQDSSGRWKVNPAGELAHGQVTSSSMFYHHWFKRILANPSSHLLNLPGDWDRISKFLYLGVKVGRIDEPLLRHYVERNQNGSR